MAILDAWVDGSEAFCVVYRSPFTEGLVGIRRTVADAASSHNQRYRLGDMTDYYDMGSAEIPDPVAFGRNVADFDIGEPGPRPLRHDQHTGTSWWGTLGDALPMRPAAPFDYAGLSVRPAPSFVSYLEWLPSKPMATAALDLLVAKLEEADVEVCLQMPNHEQPDPFVVSLESMATGYYEAAVESVTLLLAAAAAVGIEANLIGAEVCSNDGRARFDPAELIRGLEY